MRRGSLGELATWAGSHPLKGEIAIVVAPPSDDVQSGVTDEVIRARLEPLLATMRVSDAARVVSETLGVARSRVYDVALIMKRSRATPPHDNETRDCDDPNGA